MPRIQKIGRGGLAGFLIALDGFLAFEDYDAIQTFNAENATYAEEMHSVALSNQANMAHPHPRPAPSLAGRKKRNRDDCDDRHDREQAFCQREYATYPNLYRACMKRAAWR